MTESTYDLDSLLVSFSNYDQQVDVVCCWHGHFEGFVKQGVFDHYPSRDLPDGRTVTPDFMVEFPGYTLAGEICRLPRQPDGFTGSVEQAKGYLALGPETDVLMLVPHSIAGQAEKRMRDEGLLGDEQVMVASFVRNDGDATPCWVFARATQLRHPSFRDGFLLDKSLHQTLTLDMDTLRIPLRYCFPQRIRYPFMNDDPPAIYTACYLWQCIFNELFSEDEYLERQLSGESLETPRVSVQTIGAICDDSGVKVRSSWIRAALDLLVDADLATTSDSNNYAIWYGKLRARRGGSHEVHQQIAERLAKKNVAELEALSSNELPGQTVMALPPEAVAATLENQKALPSGESGGVESE